MLWTDRAQTLPCPEAVQRHGCNHTCPSNPFFFLGRGGPNQTATSAQQPDWTQEYTVIHCNQSHEGLTARGEICFSQMELELMTEPWIAVHTCGPQEQTKSLNLPWLKLYPVVKKKPQTTLIWYEVSLCLPQRSKWIFHSVPSLSFAQTSHYYAWYWNTCIKMLTFLIHTFCFSVQVCM